MTNQEVFNKVAEHLLTQKMKSYSTGMAMCVYRDGMGHSCAIGALIPDSVYERGMEGFRVSALIKTFESVRAILGNVDHDLLQYLQGVHDVNRPEDWKTELGYIGRSFKLDTSILDKFQ